MGLLLRAMLGLVVLRLLVPPGACLCQLEGRTAYALASLLGKPLPPTPPEDDDHHHDGCPASCVATGLGLQPAVVDVLPPAFLDLPPVVAMPPQPRAFIPSPALHADVGTPPLFVRHCALRW